MEGAGNRYQTAVEMTDVERLAVRPDRMQCAKNDGNDKKSDRNQLFSVFSVSEGGGVDGYEKSKVSPNKLELVSE